MTMRALYNSTAMSAASLPPNVITFLAHHDPDKEDIGDNSPHDVMQFMCDQGWIACPVVCRTDGEDAPMYEADPEGLWHLTDDLQWLCEACRRYIEEEGTPTADVQLERHIDTSVGYTWVSTAHGGAS